jgi:aspartyl-tRNA(Asn)/glutamyl-tRNA(Gln) amidotransferase subunit C
MLEEEKFNVQELAALARISLVPEEAAKLSSQLEQILSYVEKLKQLNVSAVEPTAHAIPLLNVTRPDQRHPSLSPEDVLRNAPAQSNGLFVVPRIVE